MRRVFRVFWLPVLLGACLGSSGCAGAAQSQQAREQWSTGFWYWNGSYTGPAAADAMLDVLYVHVGHISHETGPYARKPWEAYALLPDHAPAAREYWLVYRFEQQGLPDLQAAAIVAESFSSLQATARRRHLNVAGIQLDIDSPTRILPQYAVFLREMRKGLPPGAQISITALLDWFRDGTAVADVIRETDEFVPQFYDVGDLRLDNGAIAAKVDGPRWGRVFNRFGRRYRVGISTFGRSRLVRASPPAASGYFGLTFYHDLTPLDIAVHPEFQLQAGQDAAGEMVLSYRVRRKTEISYTDLQAGDAIQFTLPTPGSVRAAVEGAKAMGGHCAGIVFFRWPAWNETLAMQPDDVLAAAGLGATPPGKLVRVRQVDGECVAVSCVDLFLENTARLSEKAVLYRVHSSQPLEYFLPEEVVPVRMAGASVLELLLPPYCGRPSMHLGRAVTDKLAEFTVEMQ